MSVSAIPSVTKLNAADTANTSNRVVQKQLGQDDFLKLLTVQLQQQDPMKPMEDTQSIAQMAQFSSLQQMTALQNGFQSLRLDSQLASASALIGRQVTVATADGEVTGIVEGVQQNATGSQISINGKSYVYESVTRVSPAPVEQPTT